MPNPHLPYAPHRSWTEAAAHDAPPLSVPPVKPVPPGDFDADPWPQSPFTLQFRDEIGRRESQLDGYRAFNPAGGAMGAFGRYQLRQGALMAAGLVDAAGQWTGAMGVNSAADFLADPQAQEAAFAAYMRANRVTLAMDPVGYRNIGQKVFSKNGTFAVTDAGLAAAAHRQGAGAVRDYLAYVRDQGWISNPAAVEGEDGKTFSRIEERLREFEGVPYKKPLPFPPPLPPAKAGRGR